MNTNEKKKERNTRHDACFEEIYESFGAEILNYLKAHTDNFDDAEEISQEVFVKLYRAMVESDEPIQDPRSFLFTLARNSHSDFYKGKLSEDGFDDDFELAAPVEAENFLAQKVDSILECCLMAPVLSPRRQVGLRMHVIGGLSQRDIAEFMEVSRQTIRRDLDKGYEVLRAYYELEGLTLDLVLAG